MINQINGHPFKIRITPMAIANPTEKATVKRSPNTKLATEPLLFSIVPAPAARLPALDAITVKAGSAIVVEKPRANPKKNYPPRIPFYSKFVSHFFAYGEESTF